MGGALFEFFVKKSLEMNLSLKVSFNSSISFRYGEKLFEEHLRSRIEPEKWLIVQNEWLSVRK